MLTLVVPSSLIITFKLALCVQSSSCIIVCKIKTSCVQPSIVVPVAEKTNSIKFSLSYRRVGYEGHEIFGLIIIDIRRILCDIYCHPLKFTHVSNDLSGRFQNPILYLQERNSVGDIVRCTSQDLY